MKNGQTRRACTLFAVALIASGAAFGQELGPCENEQLGERAQCGTLSVLEDRERPEGRKIDLNIVVLRATEKSKEPVFMLAGGPGQGATDLAGLALGPFAPVLESRDFVFVDQRGTGKSNPLLCPNGSADNPQAAFGGLFDPEMMADCMERLSGHADLPLYSTPHVIDDLEQVRAWLGYEKVMLWGGSGGTRTALVWMRQHPERFVGAVLDGVTPTNFHAPSGMARAAHDALEHVFEDCEAQESCHAAYPELDKDFRKVLWLFEGGPVKTHITREDGTEVPVTMTRGDFTYALRAMLYQARRIKPLPGLIHRTAQSGDVSPFAQGLWLRDVNLRPVVAMGVHFGAYCNEDMPFINPKDIPGLTEGTFLGTYLMEQYGGVCDFWQANPVSRDYLQPTTSDVPTLIYSGYYDPSTPPSMGEEAHRHLPDSRHVVVRNEAHGSGFGCGRAAQIAFLESGSLDGLGPICEEAGPIEFDAE
jgi:pimeloyl-ACP methyl ester carboxylesterase